jgi:hypothetical protein
MTEQETQKIKELAKDTVYFLREEGYEFKDINVEDINITDSEIVMLQDFAKSNDLEFDEVYVMYKQALSEESFN